MPKLVLKNKEEIDKVLWNEDGWKPVHSEAYDQSRWHVCYEFIVLHEATGKHYKYFRRMAATEMQEHEEFDERFPLELYEVHQVEKVVLVWADVPEE